MYLFEKYERMTDAEKKVFVEYASAFISETNEMVCRLILDGKIRLRDIPFHIRVPEQTIYTYAFRVSRNKLEKLVEDLQILMTDIESLVDDDINKRYGNVRERLVRYLLVDAIEAHEFRGHTDFELFKTNIYIPFLRRMLKVGVEVESLERAIKESMRF